MGVFTVTCLEIDGSAGWNFFLDLNKSYAYCSPHYASQYKLCVTVYLRYICILSVVGCFVNIFWKIQENFTVGGFREGRSGYTKHKYFFALFRILEEC